MKLKYNFAIQHICDFWVAVPVGDDMHKYNGVLNLNETACDMMTMLREEISEEQLVARMLQEYDVSETQLREEVHQFIQQLQDANVLVD